jgi:hypothetical protein
MKTGSPTVLAVLSVGGESNGKGEEEEEDRGGGGVKEGEHINDSFSVEYEEELSTDEVCGLLHHFKEIIYCIIQIEFNKYLQNVNNFFTSRREL